MLNRGRKIERTCQYCGETFLASAYEVEVRGRGLYCSNACQVTRHKVKAPTTEELSKVYHEDKMSTNQLARYFGVSKGTIYNWMKAYQIECRSTVEGQIIAQTGMVHSEAWNKAIGAGHRRLGAKHHFVGRNNPMFRQTERFKNQRSKGGIRPDLGLYLRSSWENNYLRYLIFLQEQGNISGWQYEPETFHFEGVKRAPYTYTPDFKITFPDGHVEFHEVKGYMDSKSKGKLARMAKFFPDIKIVVIGKEEYKEIAKWSRLLKGWEYKGDDTMDPSSSKGIAKQLKRATHKAYVEAHREELAAKAKVYREANKERIQAYQATYRADHRRR